MSRNRKKTTPEHIMTKWPKPNDKAKLLNVVRKIDTIYREGKS